MPGANQIADARNPDRADAEAVAVSIADLLLQRSPRLTTLMALA
jgi:hypothetical protein